MRLRNGKVIGDHGHEIIGYKVCLDPITNRRRIVTLLIPSWARTNRGRRDIKNARYAKYRCSEARVVGIDPPGPAVSMWDGKTVYKVGKVMKPEYYFPDEEQVCEGGIHFFVDRERAETYELTDTTGLMRDWYDNGQQESELICQGSRGKRIRTSWYQTGVPRQRITYRGDQWHGGYTEWHPNGQVMIKGYYREGNPQGVWKSWDDTGHLLSRDIYG